MSIENCSGKVSVHQVTSHCISCCIFLSSGAAGWIRRRHSTSAASDGQGNQEQLGRAEKGQRLAQPWITKTHLVKPQLVHDLKSEQVLRVLLICDRARLLALMCGMGGSRGEHSSLCAI